MDMTSRNIDADSQTQPNNTTPITLKSSPFTNGTHKRQLTTTTPPPPPPPPPQQPPSSMVVSYKECLKNHAASLGGHALDGCGEFMPSSSLNPNDPRSLKCAACGCHRNFHRREPQEHILTTTTTTATATTKNSPPFLSCIYTTPSTTVPPPQPPPPLPLPHRGPISKSTSPSESTSPSHSPSPISSPSSPPPLSHLPPSYHHSSAPHMLLALGGNAYSTPPQSDHDQHHHHHQNHLQRNLNFASSVVKLESHNNNSNSNNNNTSSGKKRYRTKFSKEQKEKMHGFSEKLGWRMQKGDDGLVQKFCNDIGVSRGVFKVWMHNNKNSSLRKRSESDVGIATQIATQNDDKNNVGNDDVSNNVIHHMNEDGCVNVHVSSVNGLSS